MTFIKKIWCPTYAAKNREQLFEYTLKNMLVYLVFLVIACTIILTAVPSLRYTYAEILRKQFVQERFVVSEGNSIDFTGIKTAEDFWTYLEKVVCVYLYNDYWYSWDDQIKATKADDKKVLYDNKILGVPRLRQVRVRNDSCLIHAQFQKSFATCHGSYNANNEDTNAFGLRNETAWQFNKPDSYNTYWGKLATYHMGGYYQDLGMTRNETEEILKNLKDNLWIQRNTRALFLDFTLYNGNINLFCIVKLVFEFPSTGGIIPTHHFYPADLIKYVHGKDYFLLFLEALATLFIFYYTAMEIYTFRFLRKYYFTYCWNYIELLIIIAAYITIGFGIFRQFYVKSQIAYTNENPYIYVSYESVGKIHKHVNNLLGIILFVLWTKIFKFVNLSRTWGQLSTTLSRCAADVVGFSVMFFIIFFAFAQVGYLVFGGDVESFSTFSEALMTLLMTILGEFDYYSIEDCHRVLAPIFFITYSFFVFFVLINMFLAIITDAYAEVKEEKYLKEVDGELDDYIIKRSIGRFLKKSEVSGFAGEEILDKIKEILITCSFTNAQIEHFFETYGFGPDRKISREDLDELLTIIQKSQEEEEAFAPKVWRENKVNRVTMDAFIMQQDKIELLEYEIEALRSILNEIQHKDTNELVEDDAKSN